MIHTHTLVSSPVLGAQGLLHVAPGHMEPPFVQPTGDMGGHSFIASSEEAQELGTMILPV